MFNAQKPHDEDLPSGGKLIRSTIIAIAAAIAILVTVILPAEYGVDPTRVGQALGLTEMGEIKRQLAEEAQAEKELMMKVEKQSSVMDKIFGLFISTAQAAEHVKSNSMKVQLEPGQGVEIKLMMVKGTVATYKWTAGDGKLNYDLHGEGKGKKIRYQKGRGVPGDSGTLKAAFDGAHGWFWRNRTRDTVTMTLEASGEYTAIKRVK
jgi:hypothetical protein